jgi:hypothetical protein
MPQWDLKRLSPQVVAVQRQVIYLLMAFLLPSFIDDLHTATQGGLGKDNKNPPRPYASYGSGHLSIFGGLDKSHLSERRECHIKQQQ